MITYQREFLFEAVGEADELLRLNHGETTLHKSLTLNPKWEKYRQLEQLQMLALFTARDNGALVGYSAFFVSEHLQYDLIHASNTVLFLHPAYRKGRVGLGLIRFCDDELTAQGVGFITWHVKPDEETAKHDFSPILTRMGYALEETIYSKLIERPHHGN